MKRYLRDLRTYLMNSKRAVLIPMARATFINRKKSVVFLGKIFVSKNF